MGPEVSAVALDLVEQYLGSLRLVARLEAAAARDPTIDVTPLLRASDRLLKQARALAPATTTQISRSERHPHRFGFRHGHANGDAGLPVSADERRRTAA
jgi:hypothetical protein